MITYMKTYNRGESYTNRKQMNYIDKYNKDNYRMYHFRVQKTTIVLLKKT